MDQLQTKTSVLISSKFKDDRIWLNGKEESIDNPRIQNVLREIRSRSAGNGGMGESPSLKVHICSENNFPTAAGLASSAAGYACLVYTLARLYGVQGELSNIARQGSGSACRSMYGGFVLWKMGQRDDGADSLAIPVAPADHWPSLHCLILVVSDQKKQVGSTVGMQTTVASSPLMAHRVGLVPQRTQQMVAAIQQRDFHTFATITMQESNQFHAVCLDTFPPVFYLTDVSRLVIRLVHAYNTQRGETRVAYTFDAGPNACLYLMEEDVAGVLGLVRHFFPPPVGAHHTFLHGIPVDTQPPAQDDLASFDLPVSEGAVKYVIHTGVGSGPEELSEAESLLTPDGLPRGQ